MRLETTQVASINPTKHRLWGITQQIVDTPIGKAVLVPRKPGRSLQGEQATWATNCGSKKGPGYILRSRQDKEKDGVWFWWEERLPGNAP